MPQDIISQIKQLASEGYGYEDIALKLRIDPENKTLRDIVLKKIAARAA